MPKPGRCSTTSKPASRPRSTSRRRTQTRQLFDNLRAALQAVGAGFEQVVKLTYYLVDATQLPIVREVRDQYINIQQPPASTAVEVRRLFLDDLLI